MTSESSTGVAGRSARRRLLGFCALALLGLAACNDPKPKGPAARAAFGIFFGGQVQEREEIPFELDRAKQIQGFRIDFSEPPAKELAVGWELEVPLPRKPSRSGAPSGPERIVRLGEARTRVGEPRFDQLLPFQPGDPLGTWKIKVTVEGQTVIDRGFVVYDANARARARKADGGA